FLADVTKFVDSHRSHPVVGPEIELLGAAQESLMQGAMTLLGWSQDKTKVHLIPLNANRFLKMMSQLAVSWLLLDAAVLGQRKLADLPAQSPDRAFYEGKRHAAQWFARNILPSVKQQADRMVAEDGSPMEIPDAAFGGA